METPFMFLQTRYRFYNATSFGENSGHHLTTMIPTMHATCRTVSICRSAGTRGVLQVTIFGLPKCSFAIVGEREDKCSQRGDSYILYRSFDLPFLRFSPHLLVLKGRGLLFRRQVEGSSVEVHPHLPA